jgi:hypothetical protein
MNEITKAGSLTLSNIEWKSYFQIRACSTEDPEELREICFHLIDTLDAAYKKYGATPRLSSRSEFSAGRSACLERIASARASQS